MDNPGAITATAIGDFVEVGPEHVLTTPGGPPARQRHSAGSGRLSNALTCRCACAAPAR